LLNFWLINIMHKCSHCIKPHKNKKNRDSHESVCHLIQLSKSNSEVNIEELPSPLQMYKAFAELAVQHKKLEETVVKQQIFINAHRSKVNLIEWLNDKQKQPELKFREISSNYSVSLDDVNYLFKKTYLNTLIFILNRELKLNSDSSLLPIVAFSQKQQIYIYDSPVNICDDQSCVEWRCMELVEFNKLINSIQTKLIIALTEWKRNHAEITTQIEDLYDKTILKIVITEFTPRIIKNLLSKIYTLLKSTDTIMVVANENNV